MTQKAVTLCKWDRDNYAAQMDKLRKIVAEPKYVCLRCGRVAAKKKWLCRPVRLE